MAEHYDDIYVDIDLDGKPDYGPLDKEAALVFGVVAAGVGALVAFGIDISEAQRTALLSLIVVLIPFVQAIATRAAVWSKRSKDGAVIETQAKTAHEYQALARAQAGAQSA